MDGIFPVATFTEPRFHRWDAIKPRAGLLVGLVHIGTNVGIFAMQDYECPDGMIDTAHKTILVYIPATAYNMEGWTGRWWPLSAVIRAFPDSEISKHFSMIFDHPDGYKWIYPNLEPFLSEDWFHELCEATPELEGFEEWL